jgi:halimadienyl-diphosphate synthase
MSQMREKKLSYLKGRMINRHVTMAFSAELAGGDSQYMLDIDNLQEPNGSVGLSPSATAYFAAYVRKGDARSLAYLRQTAKPDGGQPNVSPFDVFEVAWSLWNLSLIPGMKKNPGLKPHIDFLSKAWEPRLGVAFSTAYTVKDSDDTVITYNSLLRYGIEKDIASILAYEEEGHFRCFNLEVNPSISANIHILDGLINSGLTINNSSVQKIIRFLRNNANDGGFWVDKWHASAYYPTAHAIIACAGSANDLVSDAVQWLIRTQNRNGSWGTYLPTAEETAYALQALWVWNEKVAKVPRQTILNSARWLKENMDNPYPPLWIGKCLYSPQLVVRSAVVSALALTS